MLLGVLAAAAVAEAFQSFQNFRSNFRAPAQKETAKKPLGLKPRGFFFLPRLMRAYRDWTGHVALGCYREIYDQTNRIPARADRVASAVHFGLRFDKISRLSLL